MDRPGYSFTLGHEMPATLDLAAAEEACGDSALGRVRRAYAELPRGDDLVVLSGVAEQLFAVRAWARQSGAEIVDETRAGGRTRIALRRPLTAPG
jgi:TusA-related sulfurtransferase